MKTMNPNLQAALERLTEAIRGVARAVSRWAEEMRKIFAEHLSAFHIEFSPIFDNIREVLRKYGFFDEKKQRFQGSSRKVKNENIKRHRGHNKTIGRLHRRRV